MYQALSQTQETKSELEVGRARLRNLKVHLSDVLDLASQPSGHQSSIKETSPNMTSNDSNT